MGGTVKRIVAWAIIVVVVLVLSPAIVFGATIYGILRAIEWAGRTVTSDR